MRKVINNVFGFLLWLMVGGASQANAAESEMMVRLYPEPGRMVVQVDREALKKGSEPAFLVVQLQNNNGQVVRNKRLALASQVGKTLNLVLDAVSLTAADYRLRARLLDANAAPIGKIMVRDVSWPGQAEEFQGIKILNNLVWELFQLKTSQVDGTRTFRFKSPKSRWVHVSTTCEAQGGSLALSIDQQQNLISFQRGEQGTRETMRYLPSGDHELVLVSDGVCQVKNLQLRSMPEILLHNFTDVPWGDLGESHEKFLEKHVIPHVNTFIVPRSILLGEHSYVPLFNKWRSSGRRWLSSYSAKGTPDIGGESFSLEQAYDYISTRPAVTNPLVDGSIADELIGYDDPSYSNYGKAIQRLKKDPRFSKRLFYCYVGTLHGNQHGRSLVQSVVDTSGVLAWERYLKTHSNERSARTYLQDILVSQAQYYRDRCPGVIEHLAVCVGILARPGGHQANLYPGVNHKVYVDMQFNLVANDPVFWGTYGLMAYHTEYTDEETLRWLCQLYRHYGIHGKTELATDDPYESPHLENGDFVEDLQGWTIGEAQAGSVRRVVKEGLGFLQARDGKPQGDTALLTIRSSTAPNTISQQIKNLKPGKYYTFRMMTGDFEDMSKQQRPAVQVKLDNVTVIPERTIQDLFHNPPWRKHPPYDGEDNKAWQTYHWYLFRARGKTARVTITDWAADNEPGGPIGQKLTFNYVQVHPFYTSEKE